MWAASTQAGSTGGYGHGVKSESGLVDVGRGKAADGAGGHKVLESAAVHGAGVNWLQMSYIEASNECDDLPMTPQLTYTVRALFTAADEAKPAQAAGLADYDAQAFLIAAYQRGYKWKARGGLVENFLTTLHEAYTTNQYDYFLQYLTVKKQQDGLPVLEVIDGQQRLTTLTLFFGVGRAAGWLTEHDFTQQRLRYDIRRDEAGQSLLDRYVYNTTALQELLGIGVAGVVAPTWDKFLAGQPAGTDRQDMYHLFEAAQCIYDFGKNLSSAKEREGYWHYVADYAKLIVNSVDTRMASEKIFSNLNDNRKELTDLDLVKGLLLTRPARESSNSFQQIMELRTAQGRQWDEMAQWLAQPEVAAVFGLGDSRQKDADGLQLLVTLLAERQSGWASFEQQQASAENKKRFPLYAFLRECLTGDNRRERRAGALLRELRELYLLLRDWYDDIALRNGLGVLVASNSYGLVNFQKLLRKLTNPALLTANPPRPQVWAEIKRLQCLKPLDGTTDAVDSWPVSYGEHNNDIQDFLLLLSVFPAQVRSGAPVLFDFAANRAEKWSLEHIFPQNPDETYQDLPPVEQAELLQLLAPASHDRTRQLLAIPRPARTDDETNELQDLLLAAAPYLNGLGNLVLLNFGTNSALRNYSFSKKRLLLNEKVAKGAFVPAHTFGVFAKLVPDSATDRLGLWGPQEMKQHQVYLLRERAELQTFFAQ